jgi:ribosomal protein S27E
MIMKSIYKVPQTTVSCLFAAQLLLTSGGGGGFNTGNVDDEVLINIPGD